MYRLSVKNKVGRDVKSPYLYVLNNQSYENKKPSNESFRKEVP